METRKQAFAGETQGKSVKKSREEDLYPKYRVISSAADRRVYIE
jgi:hypothetical protein